jgi:hypothetical protein
MRPYPAYQGLANAPHSVNEKLDLLYGRLHYGVGTQEYGCSLYGVNKGLGEIRNEARS